ncbi:NmrA family NAD(P)-binding protein [Paenibacillus harenae]|uniref:Nucleoside-diphosphate-sugar epimerase n=1 Tax=Paenibacillus harenae TaxID=306543 RepID=A0ABT9U2N2_PAEHA|nr:NmrA family NAD(P)-binding protein [Paenibacillus harenae]MDQ0113878.1 nucleoside-diphosphate-sugar epimerase [Paenibacillus harenae]
MNKALVIRAASGLGSSIAEELASRGIAVTVMTTKEGEPKRRLTQLQDATIMQGSRYSKEDIVRAGEGADTIFFHANTTYDEKAKVGESLQAVAAAAGMLGAKLIIADGRYRTLLPQYEQLLKDVHEINAASTIVVRLSELYGANARNTPLHYSFKQIAKGNAGIELGDMNVAGDYMYLPDAARAIVDLALQEEAYGKGIQRLTGLQPISGSELMGIMSCASGVALMARRLSGWKLSLLGMIEGEEWTERLKMVDQLAKDEAGEACIDVLLAAITPHDAAVRETFAMLAKSR